jgi:uncharacterized OB-fold protein
MADLPAPFDATVLERHGDGVVLLGARCDTCLRVHFPAQTSCPHCGGALTAATLPGTGTVHAVTSTPWPLPGAPTPATIALVEFGPEVVVQGVADGEVSIGDSVAVVPLVLPGPEVELLSYAFSKTDRG